MNKELPWRSLEERDDPESIWAQRRLEYSIYHEKTADKLQITRREFLKLMGASVALAGVSSCLPLKQARAYLPLDRTDHGYQAGKKKAFATGVYFGPFIQGVDVTSYENRPIKIEPQTSHPMSLGGTSAWTQAKILELYDVDRFQKARLNGEEVPPEQVEKYLKEIGESLLDVPTALFVDAKPSPARWHLISALQKRTPLLKVYVHDPLLPLNSMLASLFVGFEREQRPFYQFKKAKVVASFYSDFLGIEGDVARYTNDFAEMRKLIGDKRTLNRLYVIEPHLTLTGSNADHRLTVPFSNLGKILIKLASLLEGSLNLPFNLIPEIDVSMSPEEMSYTEVLAQDLYQNRGSSLVTVGHQCPVWMHALSYMINYALNNTGETILFYPDFFRDIRTVDDFLEENKATPFQQILILQTDLLGTTHQNAQLKEAIQKAPYSVYMGLRPDETSEVVKCVIPMTHDFEAWGDLQATDGSVTIQQPLIDPLGECWSDLEMLGLLAYRRRSTGSALLKSFWQDSLKHEPRDAVLNWASWVQRGFRPGGQPTDVSSLIPNFTNLIPRSFPSPYDQYELLTPIDYSVADGRFANNAWLQEWPDPITKLTWDNAALMNPETMKESGLKEGDMIEIANELSQSIKIPVFPCPGTAPKTLVIPRGYGRRHGSIASGAGFKVEEFIPFFDMVVSFKKTSDTYLLASTQTHHSMEKRPLIRSASLEEFINNPHFVEKSEVMDLAKTKSHLWKDPLKRDRQQWGMSVDLNSCTGCGACVIACQAENNIPVVGKQRIHENREMHWIRIDRYFSGSVENPKVLFQPVMCQHCENAPCEQVCPFNATMHDDEGLNVQVYNRCGGTRFCGDNCPYRVRVFNFFNYPKENTALNPLTTFQRNPDVTVRFRGVMEKCTYCIQRIRAVQKEMLLGEEVERVPDLKIQTACQAACPADAIVFGDVSDPDSLVSEWKRQPQNYQVLRELNTVPRTSYLAKIFNLNPAMAERSDV